MRAIQVRRKQKVPQSLLLNVILHLQDSRSVQTLVLLPNLRLLTWRYHWETHNCKCHLIYQQCSKPMIIISHAFTNARQKTTQATAMKMMVQALNFSSTLKLVRCSSILIILTTPYTQPLTQRATSLWSQPIIVIWIWMTPSTMLSKSLLLI